MLILDTNVISALMRSPIDPPVASYLARQSPLTLWTTAISVFEIRFGLATMAAGRRRDALGACFQTWQADVLHHRVLAFEEPAAAAAATIGAKLKADGQPIDFRDLLIAGIAASRDATLVSRNERDFRRTGVRVVNPWQL